MANIYRKAALDKLSSPEQLDKTVTIISPSFWIAAIGGGVVVAVALVWSILGRLPINVNTSGIYMDASGLGTIVAEQSGIVDDVYVKEGDPVSQGQELMRFDTAAIEDQLKDLQERREAIDAVTFDSDDDVVTADNKSLIELKGQRSVADSNLVQTRAMLESRREELEKQEKKVETAQAEYEKAREEYLDKMDAKDMSGQQLAYQKAQQELATNKSYYESAKNSLLQSESTDRKLQEQKSQLEAALSQLNEEANAVGAAVQEASAGMEAAMNAQNEAQAQLASATDADAIAAAQLAYNEASAQYNDCQMRYNEGVRQYQVIQSQMEAYQQQLGSVSEALLQNAAQSDAASGSLNDWNSKLQDAQRAYNSAEDEYLKAMALQTEMQGTASKLGNAYNIALQNYQTEIAARRSLEDTVLQLATQVKAAEDVLDNQNALLKSQFISTKASILDQVDREIINQEKALDKCTVTAKIDGFVAGLNVVKGNAVQAGSTICHVSSNDEKNEVIICYAPVTQGRKLKPGMQAVIYPTTVNRQEYGHMDGTVISVSSFVSSSEEMMNQLGDAAMVQTFQQSGPVVKVVCELTPDPNTKSGYKWSSKKGASVEIPEGTIVQMDVVTEKKAPITMIIPFLKEKMSVKQDNAQ
ncbi:MAG: NHLP bacteriocin system secretion protein [Oscillospiraceae bacterium]|nr:NHLP bacteriocin system secretion protein [Oscillospiraceae bacterium]